MYNGVKHTKQRRIECVIWEHSTFLMEEAEEEEEENEGKRGEKEEKTGTIFLRQAAATAAY